MKEEAPQIGGLLSEFGTRLNEMEEKQRLIKDRAMLIGKNLIQTKDELEEQDAELKKQISKIDSEIKELKQLTKRIVNELGNYTRKSETQILTRQFKMFEPLKLARIKDVKEIVKKELAKSKKK